MSIYVLVVRARTHEYGPHHMYVGGFFTGNRPPVFPPRRVEMESLQFVGCSWFIGLIGLVSGSPKINSTETEHVLIPPLPCLF